MQSVMQMQAIQARTTLTSQEPVGIEHFRLVLLPAYALQRPAYGTVRASPQSVYAMHPVYSSCLHLHAILLPPVPQIRRREARNPTALASGLVWPDFILHRSASSFLFPLLKWAQRARRAASLPWISRLLHIVYQLLSTKVPMFVGATR
jgi:hypothetical protein